MRPYLCASANAAHARCCEHGQYAQEVSFLVAVAPDMHMAPDMLHRHGAHTWRTEQQPDGHRFIAHTTLHCRLLYAGRNSCACSLFRGWGQSTFA
jgi:hypothetical protein